MTDRAASLFRSRQPTHRTGDRLARLGRLTQRFAGPGATLFRFVAASGEYLAALAISAGCTALAYPLNPYLGPVNTVMLYLFGTTLAALRLQRGPCVMLPVANILAFDFFFVPPTFSLDVEDARYVFTLIVMLLVALTIAHLMLRIRKHGELTFARERRTAALYAMSRELIVANDATSIAAAAVRHIDAAFHSSTVLLLADKDGRLAPARAEGAPGEPATAAAYDAGCDYDPACARAAAERGERCMGDAVMGGAVYLPLQGPRRVKDVIVVRPLRAGLALSTEQLNLLDAFAAQLALSLQRLRATAESEISKVAAESALLRNTLLASISHDLRTPLAAIAGAGSLIAQPDTMLNADRRAMLGGLIERKAGDMSQLLANVLDLARMEHGAGQFRADWHAVEDLVSHSLRANQARLAGYRIEVAVSADFPLILVDATLIVQILSNLLENAAKYTPPGTTIVVSAAVRAATVLLEVADDGPGLPGDPELLFEKFQRGNPESNVVGVGLGLTICRAAARLHGGDIRALRRQEGGARFEVTLPVKMQVQPASAAEPDSVGIPAAENA
jgi:two-component system sensor histidine kinase KdpD